MDVRLASVLFCLCCLYFRACEPRLRFGPYTLKKEVGQYPSIFTSRLVSNS